MEYTFENVGNPAVRGTFRSGDDVFGALVREAESASGPVGMLVEAMVRDEERLLEAALIEVLRARGYIVERAPEGGQLSQVAVARFRTAWHAADREGRNGNRVRAGLEAARPLMNLEAAQRIDVQLLTMRKSWPAEIGELLRALREMIAPGVPSLVPEAAERADERHRCVVTGCNPYLESAAAADAHTADTGHRTARWPKRSAESERRARKRNRSGYHSRYRTASQGGRVTRDEDDYEGDHPFSAEALGQD